jgi:hypothetical protein
MTNTVIDGVDYGPLALLIGRWKGDKGMDISPEPDGSTEKNPYYEELLFEAAGTVGNAEKQTLSVVRYHQEVYRKSDQQQFHDQLGYWLWDADAATIMNSFTIPRGVAIVAGGRFDTALSERSVLLEVASTAGGEWGISQSPFMRDNAKTTAFTMCLEVDGDNMSYSETTMLDIYGRVFEHTDKSTLTRA